MNGGDGIACAFEVSASSTCSVCGALSFSSVFRREDLDEVKENVMASMGDPHTMEQDLLGYAPESCTQQYIHIYTYIYI